MIQVIQYDIMSLTKIDLIRPKYVHEYVTHLPGLATGNLEKMSRGQAEPGQAINSAFA